MTERTKEFIEKNKIIAIVRKTYGEELLKLTNALLTGGVKLIEVTFDQADNSGEEKTALAIKSIKKEFGNRILVGAGTVLSEKQVQIAHDAGAEYIISPNTNVKVIEKTNDLGLVSIPGALTASEILGAHDAGADFVKIFPVRALGVNYIKDIRGPINHVKLIATAGVNPQNLPDYLSVGFSGAGVSGYLTDKKLITKGEFSTLSQHAQVLTNIVNEFDRKSEIVKPIL